MSTSVSFQKLLPHGGKESKEALTKPDALDYTPSHTRHPHVSASYFAPTDGSEEWAASVLRSPQNGVSSSSLSNLFIALSASLCSPVAARPADLSLIPLHPRSPASLH